MNAPICRRCGLPISPVAVKEIWRLRDDVSLREYNRTAHRDIEISTHASLYSSGNTEGEPTDCIQLLRAEVDRLLAMDADQRARSEAED